VSSIAAILIIAQCQVSSISTILFIYELNKRIDEIKNHSMNMNNTFLHAMKKKINSS
jgi:hypothetical protein